MENGDHSSKSKQINRDDAEPKHKEMVSISVRFYQIKRCDYHWYLSIQKCTHKQINLAPYLITYHQRSPFLYVPFMKSLIISEPLTSSMTHVGSWMLSQTYLGTPSMLSLPPSLQALIILGVSWEYCPHNQGSGLNIQRRELYPSTIEIPTGWQKLHHRLFRLFSFWFWNEGVKTPCVCPSLIKITFFLVIDILLWQQFV